MSFLNKKIDRHLKENTDSSKVGLGRIIVLLIALKMKLWGTARNNTFFNLSDFESKLWYRFPARIYRAYSM